MMDIKILFVINAVQALVRLLIWKNTLNRFIEEVQNALVPSVGKYLGIQIPNTGTIWSRLRAEYCRICLKLHPRRKAKNSNSKAKFKKREQFSNQRLSPAGQRYLSEANSCSPTMCWKSAGEEYCAGSLNVPTDRPARRGTLQRLELPTVEAFPLLHWMVQSKSI